MKSLKLALIAGGALISAPAFADDTTTTTTTVEAGASAEVSGDGAAVAAGGEVATTAAPTPIGNWSRSVEERPYVLNKGKAAAYLGLGVAQASFSDGMGNSASFTGDSFGIGGAYGVTDKITAGLQYGFTPGIIGDADSEVKGELAIFGEIELVRNEKLNVTASADFGLDLCGSADAMGECTATKGLHAGLGARYTLAPKMSVFTGAPYGPGPVGQHLSVSLESDGPITFAVPVGFGFQATPELALHASTELATLAISNAGDSAFIGADYFELGVGALYSATPNIDITGDFVLPDLKEAQFDLYAFLLGLRWYQ